MAGKTLIVIDMQNDFIDGSLGTKEAQAIVEPVRRKIKAYLENGDEIIFTRDTHTQEYLSTSEGKHLPVEHCISGTHGWEIPEALDIPSALHIDKPSFGFTGWDKLSLSDVELCGLCTDICVVSNALIIKALFPEIPIHIDAACTAGVTPESCEAALTTLSMCQIEVIRK